MKHILLTLLIATICTTSNADAETTGTANQNFHDNFVAGKVALTCGITCSFTWSWNQRELLKLEAAESWEALAKRVSEINHSAELAYYYLAKTAYKLGYSEAAKVYIAVAKSSLDRSTSCISGTCEGRDLKADLAKFETALYNQAMKASAEADRIRIENANLAVKSRNDIEKKKDLSVIPQSDGSMDSCKAEHPKEWSNCQGTISLPNGDRYVGDFVNGKFHGWGTYYHLADNKFRGDRYTGEFRNGQRNEKGRYIYASGRPSLEGFWSSGQFLRAEKISVPLASKKLNLQVSASDPDQDGNVLITVQANADTSSLRVNGEEQGGAEYGKYTIKRVAAVGRATNITIVAVDTHGNNASKTIVVQAQAGVSKQTITPLHPENIIPVASRDAIAIIIGIQNYKNIPKAEFANEDAREFHNYAIRALGIPKQNIKMLIDADADSANVYKTFNKWLPAHVAKGGTTDIYVFYSGHGLPSTDGQSLYFLAHGSDPDVLEKTAISQVEIIASLSKVQPKSVTMFVDSCYSGHSRSGEVLIENARPLLLKASSTTYPKNFTVLSASSNDQISSSAPELKHGIFSFYLMKGLESEADKNKDGKITAGELQAYLTDTVSRQALIQSRTQEPQFVGDSTRVLVSR